MMSFEIQKVHGFKQLAKDFAREVEENDGKVIYVNLTDPGRDWHSSIHYHGQSTRTDFHFLSILTPHSHHFHCAVQGHTDTFVEAVLSEWRHIRPQDFHIQSKLSVSDFQPTKDKYNKQSIKEGKKSDALRSERVKESKEAQMVRPVSPSKTARTARRPRYEDDEDYVSPSAKIPRQSRGTAKHAKQDLKNCPLPVMPSLPNFKRISTPAIKVASPTSKKRNVAMARSSDNESCNLRTDDESDMRRPSTAASSVSAAGSPHNHYSQGYKRKKVEAIESRRTWKRVKDDFIVSDSEEDGVDSDYENIPLIAEMDSDDEDTVYVRSSQSAVKTD